MEVPPAPRGKIPRQHSLLHDQQFWVLLINGAARTVLVHHSVQTLVFSPDICSRPLKCFQCGNE
jgi:hypothetical protein